jgi:hypothetical protein
MHFKNLSENNQAIYHANYFKFTITLNYCPPLSPTCCSGTTLPALYLTMLEALGYLPKFRWTAGVQRRRIVNTVKKKC